MFCKKIKYNNFRNIKNAELDFSPGVNVFIGKNAQGKTSAIEGIYLFARGKSFRTLKDASLINFDSEYATVEALFEDANRESKSRIAYSKDGRRLCKINNVNISKLSEFIGYFRCVVFCPSHLSIVKDGPGVRRNFLDCAIAQINPSYVLNLQKYNNVLMQRNALIKGAYYNRNSFDETIDEWSVQLSEYGEKISYERAKYTEKLNRYANLFITDMTSKSENLFLYYSEPKTKEELYKELTENKERELKYKSTLYGVHKDDILINLCDKKARDFASQGQQRSIALAIKLAESEISRETGGSYPVLLLDDVLSELDDSRREYILSGIKNYQTFITSCEGENLLKIDGVNAYAVENGNFRSL